MTRDQVVDILVLVCDLWPGRLELSADTWAKRLIDVDYPDAVAALHAISDEGAVRRPTVGQLRKRVFEANPPPRRGHDGAPCTCWVAGLAECDAKHDAEWIGRQKDRDQSCAIVDEAMARGELVNPVRFRESPYLEQAVEARLAQHWYAQNARAGRAINDPGDAQGRPVKPAPLSRQPVPGVDERPVAAVIPGVMEGAA